MAMICQRRFNDKAEEVPCCPHDQDSQGVSGLFVPVIPRKGRVTLVSSCLMPQDAESTPLLSAWIPRRRFTPRGMTVYPVFPRATP
jgi:hypothetical protein